MPAAAFDEISTPAISFKASPLTGDLILKDLLNCRLIDSPESIFCPQRKMKVIFNPTLFPTHFALNLDPDNPSTLSA